jgi:hypothetical protein
MTASRSERTADQVRAKETEKSEKTGGSLGHGEMVAILEEIARTGPDTARIQAIKVLLKLDDPEQSTSLTGFEQLDELYE